MDIFMRYQDVTIILFHSSVISICEREASACHGCDCHGTFWHYNQSNALPANGDSAPDDRGENLVIEGFMPRFQNLIDSNRYLYRPRAYGLESFAGGTRHKHKNRSI